MTNPDKVLKTRDITLPTKVHTKLGVFFCVFFVFLFFVFPVVMYGCESWTIKKTDSQRIDAFELWCWRRLLRAPWTANQSILKDINPEYSVEGLMLKLKLQYLGYLTWRVDSVEKTLMLEKLEARRRKRQQKMIWLDGITNSNLFLISIILFIINCLLLSASKSLANISCVF